MVQQNLTDKLIRSLAPETERYGLMDALVPNLAIRVGTGGSKQFVMIARFPGNKNPTRRSIGWGPP